jgi:hypothetical protein
LSPPAAGWRDDPVWRSDGRYDNPEGGCDP